jgi:hypothetical protein
MHRDTTERRSVSTTQLCKGRVGGDDSTLVVDHDQRFRRD